MKPQQPVPVGASGAKSCRKAKMSEDLDVTQGPCSHTCRGFCCFGVIMSIGVVQEQTITFDSGIRLESGRILAPITLVYVVRYWKRARRCARVSMCARSQSPCGSCSATVPSLPGLR